VNKSTKARIELFAALFFFFLFFFFFFFLLVFARIQLMQFLLLDPGPGINCEFVKLSADLLRLR